MTDREMLEMAARATGYNWRDWTPNSNPLMAGWPYDWNPLTDDGDALRLAVALDIRIDFNSQSFAPKVACPRWFVVANQYADKNAATRRAIVRAAAEIGKAMAEKE
jgi:hypothetical protein